MATINDILSGKTRRLVEFPEARMPKHSDEAAIDTPAPAEQQADKKSGMPLTGKVLDLVNDQYMREFESSEIYYAMSAYFADIKLEGFAAYFRRAAEEERKHAMKFFDYLIKCNVLIEMKGFTPAKTRFENPKTATTFFLTHEQEVTQLINAIADAAMTAKDFYTFEFIQWFLAEQLEEVRKAEDLSKKMALVTDNMAGLLLLDAQLKG